MEMTGDLSDFALTDILQILALSKKTGTLLVENGALEGKVLIESGKIIGAWSNQGRGLREDLLDQGVRSGLLTDKQVRDLFKRHLQSVLGSLVSVDKGRFGISLDDATKIDLPTFPKYMEGLEIEEILLEHAKVQDESRISHQNSADRVSDNDGFSFYSSSDESDESDDSSSRLRESSFLVLSMLSELRASFCETDVSLMVLRCGSELTGRGILFGLKEDTIFGIGQYGIGEGIGSQISADSIVKSVRIPKSGDSLVAMVGRTGQAYQGPKGSGFWDNHFQKVIGIDQDNLEVCILPIVCLNKPRFILYTDNYPEAHQLEYLEILSVFVEQAGLVLDKLSLFQELEKFHVI